MTEMNSNIRTLVTSALFGQADLSKSNMANIALLGLRFYAGYTIMGAGLDKLPLPDWMVDQVVSMGFPFPVFFAWVASFGEFAFGALLCLGLATRASGLMLAVIMGVASFGFQGVIPFFDMHIAQHFFWIFLSFAFLGGGRFSLDYWLNKRASSANSKLYYLALPVFLILLSIGLFREFNATDQGSKEGQELEISSINIPGSFNDWDPSANEMQKVAEDRYIFEKRFDQAGLIEFKFTANNNWDVNLGETDQSKAGFPISGRAELDQGNDTQNIKAYIPAPGIYKFELNTKTYEYDLKAVARPDTPE